MEGLPCDSAGRLRLTRAAESSRLQFDLLRRAFELLVPDTVERPPLDSITVTARRAAMTAQSSRRASQKEC